MSKSLQFFIYIHCKMAFTDLLRSCREWNSIWLHAMMFTFPSRVVNTTSAIVSLITGQQEKRIMGCWCGLKKFLKHPCFSGSLKVRQSTNNYFHRYQTPGYGTAATWNHRPKRTRRWRKRNRSISSINESSQTAQEVDSNLRLRQHDTHASPHACIRRPLVIATQRLSCRCAPLTWKPSCLLLLLPELFSCWGMGELLSPPVLNTVPILEVLFWRGRVLVRLESIS